MIKPLIEQRADPQIYRHTDGYYYFTASVPEFDRIELRRARTLAGLAEAQPVTIWRRRETGELSCNIWAPELHYADGQWAIYFAAARAGADESGCYDHRLYALLSERENPIEGGFGEPVRVLTGWESFTLDATRFELRGESYMVWAQRDFDIAGNSNLYIARMKSPTELELPATLISVPEYPWECEGFLVNEGPSVLRHAGRLYLTYSGSATDERYCIGMLEISELDDPICKSSWIKSASPVMVTETENGIYGPGHNSFTTDEDGRDVLVFHARPYPGFKGTALSDPNRHTFLRVVEYGADGRPIFSAL